eukprot:UN25967
MYKKQEKNVILMSKFSGQTWSWKKQLKHVYNANDHHIRKLFELFEPDKDNFITAINILKIFKQENINDLKEASVRKFCLILQPTNKGAKISYGPFFRFLS